MEPYIKSILNVSQKVPSRLVSGLTVGLTVAAEVGPIGLTAITSPKQFLNLYTVNNTLTKADHASLHNAYFLSRSVDLVVGRATNTTTYPLVGLGGEDRSIMLPNGSYADTIEVITPTIPVSPGDYRSMWLQIDNVAFVGTYPDNEDGNPNYGSGSFSVGPFEEGTDIELTGTATMETKGTLPEDMEIAGLGTEADWDTVVLSDSLTQSDALTFNTGVYQEIADAFKKGGAAERDNIHVEVSDDSFIVYSSSEYPVNNTNFLPVDADGVEKPIHNLSYSTSLKSLTDTEPYLIGYKNVGSVNTLYAWVSDVTTTNVVTGKVDGFQYWNLNLKDKVDGLLTYKVSSNPEAVDVQGNPIYYTWIEDIRTDIVYVKNEASTSPVVNTPEPSSPNVGYSEDFVLSVSTTEKLLSSAATAATQFEDYENRRIQLYTDAGWYNKSIGKQFETVASSKQGLACIGIDPSIKDVRVIKLYASGYDGYYSIIHTNGGKDTSVVGFQIPISPSCYFIESVAKNTTRNASYAPTFSKVNGTITEGNLYHSYSKSQRDELNEARVNVLLYDSTDGVSYINNNLLTDSTGSLIDEDQSIRLVNDLQYDIEKLMENFYSRFNISGTREAVVTSIDNYIRTIILSQSYTIANYYIECSEVNNNDVTIENNELKVEVYIQLNHSIKYITVTTNVVPTL